MQTRRQVNHTRPSILIILIITSGVLFCMQARSQEGQGHAQLYDLESIEPGDVPCMVLPLTFTVAPHCRLYSFGWRIETASFAFDERGALTLNGRRVFPCPPLDGPPLQPINYKGLAENVPVAQRLKAEGATWQEAYEAIAALRRQLEDHVIAAVMQSESAGVSPELAARQAAEAADSLGMLAEAPRLSETHVYFKYIGAATELGRLRSPKPVLEDERQGPREYSPEECAAFAAGVWRSVGPERQLPTIVLLCPGYVRLSGESAVQGFAQIERVLAGEEPSKVNVPGPMNVQELMLIQRRQGEK